MEKMNECKALHLHLALDLGGLSEPQLTILEKCGNVKDGISRDVIFVVDKPQSVDERQIRLQQLP